MSRKYELIPVSTGALHAYTMHTAELAHDLQIRAAQLLEERGDFDETFKRTLFAWRLAQGASDRMARLVLTLEVLAELGQVLDVPAGPG